MASRPTIAIQGPRRVLRSCFRMTILLILCHGIWNVHRCSASSSLFRPISQPLIRISKALAMGSQEGNQWPLDLLSNSELSPSIEVTDPRNDFYIRDRAIRDSSTSHSQSTLQSHGPQSQNTIQACLYRLRDALTTICNGSFHSPTNRKRSFVTGKGNGFVFHRVQRAVVNECCKNPCSPDSMKKYCGQGENEPQQFPVSDPSSRVTDLSGEVIEGTEDEENEIASSPTPDISEPTEPSSFSLLRFILYLVNHPTPNRKPKVASSRERTGGLVESRIQDMLEVDQTNQFGSGNNPVRIEKPTSDLTFVASEGSIPPAEPSGHQHHPHPSHVRTRLEHATSRNAVTSTISPFMIPLGRNFM